MNILLLLIIVELLQLMDCKLVVNKSQEINNYESKFYLQLPTIKKLLQCYREITSNLEEFLFKIFLNNNMQSFFLQVSCFLHQFKTALFCITKIICFVANCLKNFHIFIYIFTVSN